MRVLRALLRVSLCEAVSVHGRNFLAMGGRRRGVCENSVNSIPSVTSEEYNVEVRASSGRLLYSL